MLIKHKKHLSLLLILLVAFSFASCSGRLTPTPTPTSAPTPTPTEPVIQPPQGWELYSDYFISNVGIMRYEFYYPPDWYTYRGSTAVLPGGTDVTYIKSYASSGGKIDIGYQPAGTIKISIGAQTCTDYINCDTRDFTLLGPGFNGIREVYSQFFRYDSDGNKIYTTHWDICTVVGEYKFCMYAYLVGTPEENGDQIAILDQIMNTIILTYAPNPYRCD